MNTTTQWFAGAVNPVHLGVYQRCICELVFYSRWNGRDWMGYCRDFGSANTAIARSSVQDADWRGLTGK